MGETMPSPVLVDKQQELDAARKEAKEFYAANPTDKIKDDKDLLDQSVAHNRKMADLHDEVERLQSDEKGRNQANAEPQSNGRTVKDAGPTGEQPQAIKSLGDMLADSEPYQKIVATKAQLSDSRHTIRLGEIESLKTLITLGDINAAPQRQPGIMPFAVDESTVADLMLPGTTDSNTITYWEETTFTNAAATVVEGEAKLESALDFTERTENVRKIATWIPATDELLSDVAGFRSYLEGRLRFMVEREEEDQLLNGDGTPPNISGILDRSIQTYASGSEIELDAIYHGITEVRVDGLAEPTGIVMHPRDWANTVLTHGGASDNAYVGGNPFQGDFGNRAWGLPVRVTPAIAGGTALVGAFKPFSQIFRRSSITVTVSTEHASYFIENKVAVLAESRLALAVYRPLAFCKVTGLGTS